MAALPFIPEAATKLLDQMGVPEPVRNFAEIGSHWYSPLAESDYRLEQPKGLFPRLELDLENGGNP